MKNQVFIRNIQALTDRFGSGKVEKFARFLGIPSSAVRGWVKGSLPDGIKTLIICEKCGVTQRELFYGEKKEKTVNKVGEQHSPYEYNDSPVIEELLDDARYVLTSGNALAFSALERNIKYFRHAVLVESEIKLLRQDHADLKVKFSDLEAQVKALKRDCDPVDLLLKNG